MKEEVERLKSDQSVLQENMQKSSEESSQHTNMLEQRIQELDSQKAVSILVITSKVLLTIQEQKTLLDEPK